MVTHAVELFQTVFTVADAVLGTYMLYKPWEVCVSILRRVGSKNKSKSGTSLKNLFKIRINFILTASD